MEVFIDGGSASCVIDGLAIVCDRIQITPKLEITENDEVDRLVSLLKDGEISSYEIEEFSSLDIIFSAIVKFLGTSRIFYPGIDLQSYSSNLPGHIQRMLGAFLCAIECIVDVLPSSVEILVDSIYNSLFHGLSQPLLVLELLENYRSMFPYCYMFSRKIGRTPRSKLSLWESILVSDDPDADIPFADEIVSHDSKNKETNSDNLVHNVSSWSYEEDDNDFEGLDYGSFSTPKKPKSMTRMKGSSTKKPNSKGDDGIAQLDRFVSGNSTHQLESDWANDSLIQKTSGSFNDSSTVSQFGSIDLSTSLDDNDVEEISLDNGKSTSSKKSRPPLMASSNSSVDMELDWQQSVILNSNDSRDEMDSKLFISNRNKSVTFDDSPMIFKDGTVEDGAVSSYNNNNSLFLDPVNNEVTIEDLRSAFNLFSSASGAGKMDLARHVRAVLKSPYLADDILVLPQAFLSWSDLLLISKKYLKRRAPTSDSWSSSVSSSTSAVASSTIPWENASTASSSSASISSSSNAIATTSSSSSSSSSVGLKSVMTVRKTEAKITVPSVKVSRISAASLLTEDSLEDSQGSSIDNAKSTTMGLRSTINEINPQMLSSSIDTEHWHDDLQDDVEHGNEDRDDDIPWIPSVYSPSKQNKLGTNDPLKSNNITQENRKQKLTEYSSHSSSNSSSFFSEKHELENDSEEELDERVRKDEDAAMAALLLSESTPSEEKSNRLEENLVVEKIKPRIQNDVPPISEVMDSHSHSHSHSDTSSVLQVTNNTDKSTVRAAVNEAEKIIIEDNKVGLIPVALSTIPTVVEASNHVVSMETTRSADVMSFPAGVARVEEPEVSSSKSNKEENAYIKIDTTPVGENNRENALYKDKDKDKDEVMNVKENNMPSIVNINALEDNNVVDTSRHGEAVKMVDNTGKVENLVSSLSSSSGLRPPKPSRSPRRDSSGESQLSSISSVPHDHNGENLLNVALASSSVPKASLEISPLSSMAITSSTTSKPPRAPSSSSGLGPVSSITNPINTTNAANTATKASTPAGVLKMVGDLNAPALQLSELAAVSGVIFEGWLEKKSRHFGMWKKCFVVLGQSDSTTSICDLKIFRSALETLWGNTPYALKSSIPVDWIEDVRLINAKSGRDFEISARLMDRNSKEAKEAQGDIAEGSVGSDGHTSIWGRYGLGSQKDTVRVVFRASDPQARMIWVNIIKMTIANVLDLK